MSVSFARSRVRKRHSHDVAAASGQIYSWGQGQCGQLGKGRDLKATKQPVLVPITERIVRVECGPLQSVACSGTARTLARSLVMSIILILIRVSWRSDR